MKYKNIYVSGLLAMIIWTGNSCADDRSEPVGELVERFTDVVFVTVECPELHISRAINENRIWDGTSVVYDESGSLLQSHWTANASTGLTYYNTAPQRRYQFMAEVNLPNSFNYGHADSLRDQWSDYGKIIENGRMPMTYYAENISIPYNYGIPYYYYAQMKRVLAKVMVNVTVAESAGDITLRTLDVCNIPDKVKLFETEPTRPVELTYTVMTVSDAVIAENAITATVYLPENMQGENPAVTMPEEKHAENAPANASYIRIGALVSGRPVNYNIYIGENKTDDFNLRRNTFHTYNITITGADSADRRIEFTLNDDTD